MATNGDIITRNKPALYKPTDFGKRLSASCQSSTSEILPVKIQQRPPSRAIEKNMESTHENTKIPNSSADDEKPGGIAQKDIDKIAKLKEFMAKQQLNEKEFSKDSVTEDVKGKFSSGSTSKLSRNNGSKPGTHESGSGKSSGRGAKGKYADGSRKEDRSTKSKAFSTDKDKIKGEGGRANSVNRSQRVMAKSPTGRRKQNQNEKSGKTSKGNESTDQKNSKPTMSNGGTRAKTSLSQKEVQVEKNTAFRGQNKHTEFKQQKQVPTNSYYSQPSNPSTFQSKEGANWTTLPHNLNSTVPGKSILGKPQDSSKNKVVTVVASKDKSEQKKSLDFIKNFFDNDPEVQYHRKINAENKSVPKVPDTTITTKELPSRLGTIHTSGMQSNAISNIGHGKSILSTSLSQNISQDPRSIEKTFSSIYNHSNMHQNGLHVNSQRDHENYPTNGISSMTSSSQLQGTMNGHQSTMNMQNFDLYSQASQINPLLNAANYHDVLSNYQQSLAQNITNVSHGFPSYSGYFSDGNHTQRHHLHHQQLDPSVVSSLIQKNVSKNWQEKALNKCGPIDSNQARSLIEQLIDDTYECMVCCETIKWNNQVWSCSNCYHVFHLSCIRKWARSETAAVKDESGWRCPGCQNVSTRPPNKYYCFCGKVRDPDWNPRDGITPHSCGEVCSKKRVNPACEHNCNELCHPGPCPICPVMVAKHCPCGKTITKSRCGQANLLKCENICSKFLNCGVHRCQLKCHQGECGTCDIKHSEECFCGKERHFVVCGTKEIIEDEVPGPEEKCQKKYRCNHTCDNILACKNHKCEDVCHPGDCKSCALLPENVHYCPCGKHKVSTLLEDDEVRNSCVDPIPTCESFCGKKLSCGPKGLSHLCMMKCHTGKCPPCQKVTTVQCRCGASKKEISCIELNPGEDILCERKCNKKRKCGRHKCNQKCCTDRDHACDIICGKKLSCGMHKCEEVCHTGFCPPCWRAGFDELSCHCGTTVLYPPIACGMKPPECDQPCARRHPCGHPPTHTCHSDDICPPCTLLINKQCMGGHEIWKNVPCHLSDVSCGRGCGKISPCGFHKCVKTCHKGTCIEDGEVCTQPCPIKRKDCDHPCGARCHTGLDCPLTPCKAQVTIRCRCGRKSANAFCLSGSVTSAYESFNSEILTSQLRNLQSGQSIDLASLTNAEKKPKFLDCDEECSRIERNRKLAEALGIENPEGGHFQPLNYSSFLKQEAKTQFTFIQRLEEILENLVGNAKKSTQSQIQHSLPPMNSTQRKIVHELADQYGCKTYSLDPEPKRNTVVIATKESFIPSIKLSTLVEREIMNQPPPQPVMLCKDGQNYMVLGPQIKPILKKTHNGLQPKVDYFDDNFK